MSYNPYGNFLEDRILSATPLELVRMLFDAAQVAVGDARRHLALGNIAERGRSVSRAVAILAELAQSLDVAAGGEMAQRLLRLYDYVQRILLEAHYEQSDAKLAEAEQLLAPVAEAWAQITASSQAELAAPPVAEPSEYALHQWSA